MFLLLLMFAIVSCGFKLRGDYNLPESMHSIVISAPDQLSELIIQLKHHIKSSGVEVITKPTTDTPSFLLKIDNDKVEKRISSIDNAGRASGYEVNLLVSYELLDDHSKTVVALKEISLLRDYLIDVTNPLGSSEEEKLLIKNMRISAARMIMLGISARNAQ